MFPNDDICNPDVAKEAANRLFAKYSSSNGEQQPALGKKEVSRLIKATYEAINMRNEHTI